MSGSSNLNSFRDRGQVAVQLVSCGVLLPGLVQDCTQHSCIIAILLYSHIIITMIYPSERHMYTFKYRKIRNTLTDEITVVQERTFINFLTSEFGSSTRGEKDTILKSLSYHTMLRKLKTLGHISWSFRSPFIFAGRDPKNFNRLPQRS